MRITGRTHGGRWDPRTNNTPITSAQTALLTVCVHNAPVPRPRRPELVHGVDDARHVDLDAGVRRHDDHHHPNDFATNPFFFGWTTELNLTAAKARITQRREHVEFRQLVAAPERRHRHVCDATARTTRRSTCYTVQSGFNMALRADGGGASSRTFTACVNGYSTNGNGGGNGNGGSNRSASSDDGDAQPSSRPVPCREATVTTAAVQVEPDDDDSDDDDRRLVQHDRASTTAPAGTATSTTVPSTSGPANIEPDADPTGRSRHDGGIDGFHRGVVERGRRSRRA